MINADTIIKSVTIGYTSPTAIAPPNDGGGGGNGGGSCTSCTYAPTGDIAIDAPRLVAWLMCQLSNIYWCDLRLILLGIWRTILAILTFIGWTRIWAGNTITQIAGWQLGTLTIVINWLGGTLQNVVNQLAGYIQQIYPSTTVVNNSGGSNFWDVLITLFSSLSGSFNTLTTSLRDVLTTFLTGLVTVIGDVTNLLIVVVNAIFGILVLVADIVIALINSITIVVVQVIHLIAFIPKIAGTFISAFQGPASMPVMNGVQMFSGSQGPSVAVAGSNGGMGSLNCSVDPLFHLCLGLYVLDNTLFWSQDPYSGFNILTFINMGEAVLALLAVLWLVRKLKSAVNK